MSKKPEDLVALRVDQIKPASRILARAFMDDPISILAYPEEKDRQTRLAYMFEFSLRYSFSSDQTYTTSERLEGVTVWRRRGIHHPELFWHLFSSGAIWLILKAGLGTGNRMRPFNEYIEYKHQDIISGPHWYLIGLGVDPSYQGQGYGARLYRQMQAQVNTGKLPCYLETAKEKNVSMYQHFGFRIMDEFIAPGTSFKVWAMLKE